MLPHAHIYHSIAAESKSQQAQTILTRPIVCVIVKKYSNHLVS